MNTSARFYASLNQLGWTVFALGYELEYRSILEVNSTESEWFKSSGKLSNMFSEEVHLAEIDISDLESIYMELDLTIIEQFETHYRSLSSNLPSTVKAKAIFYLYCSVVHNFFMVYKNLMENPIIKGTEYYVRYQDNREFLDGVLSDIEMDKKSSEQDFETQLRSESNTLIQHLTLAATSISDLWRKELYDYLEI